MVASSVHPNSPVPGWKRAGGTSVTDLASGKRELPVSIVSFAEMTALNTLSALEAADDGDLGAFVDPYPSPIGKIEPYKERIGRTSRSRWPDTGLARPGRRPHSRTSATARPRPMKIACAPLMKLLTQFFAIVLIEYLKFTSRAHICQRLLEVICPVLFHNCVIDTGGPGDRNRWYETEVVKTAQEARTLGKSSTNPDFLHQVVHERLRGQQQGARLSWTQLRFISSSRRKTIKRDHGGNSLHTY